MPVLLTAAVHGAGGLAGCASQSIVPAPVANLFTPAPKDDGYHLSKAELGYDCPKLTGHMRVRMTQMRGIADREPTSETSRKVHQTVTVLSGSGRGADPAVDRARDLQMLEAYNRQLAAKTCKPLDIEAELKGTPTPDGGKSLTAKSKTPAPAKG